VEARYVTDPHGPEDEAAAPTPATASTPGAGPPPDRPAPYAGFSMRPAMIVVGLAALILVGFVAIGLATNGAPARTDTSRSIQVVSGSSLRAVRAAPALSVITRSGEPPSNILNAVSLPEGSIRVSHQFNSASADQFDAQIGLVSDASQGAIRTFYLSDMKAQGWQVFETGPARNDPGAFEVLGKKAGSDGFFWEMGAVVSATTFGADAPPAGQTAFTVRLFQVPDPD
jgi:hypothetical protein